MRSFFKAVFAIWVGVSLILPNCPCQVFNLFGIETAEESSGAQNESQSVQQGSLTLVVCHCEDDVPKVAEPAGTARGGVDCSSKVAFCPWASGANGSLNSLVISDSRGRSPPGYELPQCLSAKREVLCSFLV